MTAEEVSNGGASAADSAVLLGRAACPVWLNPERFLEQEFNADACVADLRRYVPLATLQNELSSYLATLKTKLVEVINEDYADYVGLSGRLANVEGAVVRMRKPLLELRDKLHAVQEAVRTELNSLNQGLRKRKEVATQRALLELILEVAHVAAKVDKLLEEVVAADQHATAAAAAPSAGASGGGGAGGAGAADAGGGGAGSQLAGPDLVAQCRLLERVAAEVSRLAFLANKGKDLAFIRSLEPRIASHRAALRGRLSAALTAALAPAPPGGGSAANGAAANGGPRNTAAALHALHAAADLGEAEAAEGAVRRVVVAPLVERLITEHKAHGPAGGASAGGGGLAALLSAILAAVRRELGPLLDACLAPGSALRGLDLLGAAVLDEVQGALAAALPGVFSPGVPPAFHANYLAAAAWLRQLEGLCATKTGVERLRAGPAYGALMRRWNTSVYFSLLFQEIAGELEDALSGDKLEPAPASASSASSSDPSPPLLLAPSAALLRCLRRAASPDVVLPPLTDRFLRLALQLAQRYATWALAATAARREAAAAAAAAGAGAPPGTPGTPGAAAHGGGAGVGAGAGTGSPGAGAGGAGAGAGGAGGAAGGPVAWSVSLPAEELMAVVHDTEAVAAFLAGPFTATFLELLPLPAAAAALATAASSGVASPLASASSLASLGSMPPPPTPAAGGAADGGGEAAAAAAAAAVAAAVRGALAEAAEAVRGAGRGLAAALAEEAVERCVVVVRQLKGITATYRMTAKAPPSRASHYVGGVLAPLRGLLEAGAVRRLAPALQQSLLVLPVGEGVCARYAALAEELLVSVRKTESSLKRLKKAKAGGEEDAAAAVSDSDKITLQLHLDAAELGQQLGRLLLGAGAAGATPAQELAAAAAAVPSFRRLQEVVAPPPGLMPPPAGGAAAAAPPPPPHLAASAPAFGAPAAPAAYQPQAPPPPPPPQAAAMGGAGSGGGAGFMAAAAVPPPPPAGPPAFGALGAAGAAPGWDAASAGVASEGGAGGGAGEPDALL
ncbi:hypothetical protein HXX76_011535 [Chlamydomonas incerta]|uniref:Conserved oligomeric Golgi complex subunit 2 n=1 Tax=Chlamydomonas incerta TaxID=51695 RepID=A0A835SX36_CHLIN|nr:hypothetical protein HXX76_011535 [Chlamydomonas incerta]|eukprot:KAG2428415.1 hypothetical protein HXX76_011535 [Chlamydomonas incerta]